MVFGVPKVPYLRQGSRFRLDVAINCINMYPLIIKAAEEIV